MINWYNKSIGAYPNDKDYEELTFIECGGFNNMTKEEYDKITELLIKRRDYNDIIIGIKNTGDCRISGIYSDGAKDYLCVLDKEDRDTLQDYFNKKLDDIANQLKELGYND